jgi:hypothetical protein
MNTSHFKEAAAVWARWTVWLGIAWAVELIVTHFTASLHDGTSTVILWGSCILCFVATAMLSIPIAAVSLLISLKRERVVGAQTPLRRGLLWSIAAGSIAGAILLPYQHTPAVHAHLISEAKPMPPPVGRTAPSSTDAPRDMPYRSGYLHRVCSTAATDKKYDYVMTLDKQYSDDNAPALTESQVARIWDGQGNCGPEAGGANLSRSAMTHYMLIEYLGSVMTASVKWRLGDYRAARYFVDEFLGTETMINRKARYMGWQNWLDIDKPIAQQMSFMNAELTRRGFPSEVPANL